MRTTILQRLRSDSRPTMLSAIASSMCTGGPSYTVGILEGPPVHILAGFNVRALNPADRCSKSLPPTRASSLVKSNEKQQEKAIEEQPASPGPVCSHAKPAPVSTSTNRPQYGSQAALRRSPKRQLLSQRAFDWCAPLVFKGPRDRTQSHASATAAPKKRRVGRPLYEAAAASYCGQTLFAINRPKDMKSRRRGKERTE